MQKIKSQAPARKEKKISRTKVILPTPWPRTRIMLTSTKHAIYLAHKCKNVNKCWHFNLYKHGKYTI